MSEWALFIAVFLACAVEAVEATTIVLAAGTARDWRSAFLGMTTGLIVLAVIIAVAGPAITFLPLGALRLVVGGLLLVFGLQWLRKAILRSSGYKALHDEDKIFQNSLAEARSAARGGKGGVRDWYAFTLSFKGVLLEGLEVVFIVLTFGTIQNKVGTASLAAVIAVVLVAAAGFAVRKPLARVPENTMKFVVGVMLTSFGIFWGAEGAGATWPGADVILFALVPFVAVVCLVLVAILRKRNRSRAEVLVSVAAGSVGASEATVAASVAEESSSASEASADAGSAEPPVRRTFGQRLAAFGNFWYDFIIGDDWRVTAGIVVSFVLTGWLTAAGGTSWWLVPVAVLVLLPFSLVRLVRH
ncbi:MAG: hypothetical protein QOH55_2299 [Microbacteriaceae bacterium]|jgi:uncharacterized membrane protein|nr:hypothetical protein [Microbacteriaceae bacterium]